MVSSMSASWTCQQCKKTQRGAKVRTMTGRTVCAACSRLTESAALGMMTGGSTTESVQNAVGIHTLREWFRRSRSAKKPG